MTAIHEITPSLLRELLRYDPEADKLFWRTRQPSLYSDKTLANGGIVTAERSAARFNRKYAGKEAFTTKDRHGYYHSGIFGKVLPKHRVIWVMHYGAWPIQVDHINGDRADNRLSNLREVSSHENNRNAAMKRSNTSGITGVSWSKTSKKWVAYIRAAGKCTHLGMFETLEEAGAVRKAAQRKLGFSERHGAATTTIPNAPRT